MIHILLLSPRSLAVASKPWWKPSDAQYFYVRSPDLTIERIDSKLSRYFMGGTRFLCSGESLEKPMPKALGKKIRVVKSLFLLLTHIWRKKLGKLGRQNGVWGLPGNFEKMCVNKMLLEAVWAILYLKNWDKFGKFGGNRSLAGWRQDGGQCCPWGPICYKSLSLSFDHKVLENSHGLCILQTVVYCMIIILWSINSVTATVHEVTVKNGLLTGYK